MNETVNGLERLDILIGNWRTEGRIINQEGRQIGNIAGRDIYEWALDRKFILHHVDVMMDNDHTVVFELIQSFESGFQLHSFDNTGAFTLMHGSIDDSGTFRITGDGIRSNLNVMEKGKKMHARWEKQSDNLEWKEWIDIEFQR